MRESKSRKDCCTITPEKKIWNQELPPNAPESVRELAEEFSHLKLGYRGDLKFWENPVIYEMTDLLEEPDQTSEMKIQ